MQINVESALKDKPLTLLHKFAGDAQRTKFSVVEDVFVLKVLDF